ncbi:Putative spermidine/putrescine transport system permease protein [Hyphomicrobiales bacterium]|nr:Putative spermidine/putrescine transport system permease protein [Hyphomicrobiales bacterium]CAH1691083.1 ABC transporter permease [Hyphomicrobiales bacterium]
MWLIAPTAIILLGLFVIPQFLLLKESVVPPYPFGLSAYARFFSDSFYIAMLARTFGLAVVVTVVCLALGFPIALWLARLETRFVPILLLITTFPLLVSAVVRSFAWMVLFFKSGLASQGLVAAGIVAPGYQLMGTFAGIVIALAQVMLPLMILTLFSMLRALDRDLEHAAMNLGATPAATTWLVILPQMKGALLAGSLLVFALSVGAFATPSLIGSARVHLIAVAIQEQALELFNWPFAAAMAMILLVTSVVISLVYSRVVSGAGHDSR